MNCYTIGLTGGIASGKTAVSGIFLELGCDVIDADIVARQVVEVGSKGLSQLVDAFGAGILNKNKGLNRTLLRKLVFNDSKMLTQLNSILHPLIKQDIYYQVQQVTENFCIVVIPLLCESNQYNWLDRVLVVDVKLETQLKRLLQRDNITNELANKILQSQCSREQRLAIADYVINNEQTLSHLYKNVESLNSLYKSL